MINNEEGIEGFGGENREGGPWTALSAASPANDSARTERVVGGPSAQNAALL